MCALMVETMTIAHPAHPFPYSLSWLMDLHPDCIIMVMADTDFLLTPAAAVHWHTQTEYHLDNYLKGVWECKPLHEHIGILTCVHSIPLRHEEGVDNV